MIDCNNYYNIIIFIASLYIINCKRDITLCSKNVLNSDFAYYNLQ